MNLFMESNSAVKELEEPLKTDFAEDKDDESSDTSDNDEGTFSDLEDSLDNSDKQTTVGGPQQFIWYRSKIAVTGWVPHSWIAVHTDETFWFLFYLNLFFVQTSEVDTQKFFSDEGEYKK